MDKENTIPYFRMVIGLPGSGKSTFIQEMTNGSSNDLVHIHSSDSIRRELLGDVNDQSSNSLVFDTLHKRVKDDLKNGISCWYDATNIHKKYRKAFLDSLKSIDCMKECYLIASPIEECIERDKKRDRSVGEEVINKMYKNIDIPAKREGWDNMYLCYGNDCRAYYSTEALFRDLKTIPQNNPHHTLTIGNHCIKAYEVMEEICKREEWLSREDKDILSVAAFLHDIGKEKTATYYNRKGEKTNICHYYGHEKVGAYDSLFLDIWEGNTDIGYFIFKVADLIQLHMKLYSNPESEKYKKRLRNKLGEKEYKLLVLLNEADMSAK